MPEPTPALAETVRLLRPAGLLYLTPLRCGRSTMNPTITSAKGNWAEALRFPGTAMVELWYDNSAWETAGGTRRG